MTASSDLWLYSAPVCSLAIVLRSHVLLRECHSLASLSSEWRNSVWVTCLLCVGAYDRTRLVRCPAFASWKSRCCAGVQAELPRLSTLRRSNSFQPALG